MIKVLLLALLVIAALALVCGYQLRRLQRERFIRTFSLPPGLYDRLQKRRPHLTRKDCELVARGLRQFFLAYLGPVNRP